MFLYSPPQPYVVIIPDKYQICSGETINFLAASYNTNYVYYQWFVNDISIPLQTGYNFIYAYQNNDVVYCRITGSTSDSKISNPISKEITVFNKNTPTITISYIKSGSMIQELNPTLCAGDTAIFSSVITYGGYHPIFQWYHNIGLGWTPMAGQTNQTMSYIPVNEEQIACYMGSNSSCVSPTGVTSNVLTMKVTANSPVSVSISASPSGSICPGTSVTYTATGVNKGLSPHYQWDVNGTTVGTNYQYTYTPSDGDIISVSMTSSMTCTTGNPATDITTATVLTNTPVSIDLFSIPAYELEEGSLYYAYVASGHTIFFYTSVVGDCGSPTYQWYRIRGGVTTSIGSNSSTYSYTPASGDVIYCTFTSDCQCTTGNPATTVHVTITLYPVIDHRITISADKISICSGSTITFSALQNGYTNPQYQWKANSVNVGTNSSTWITSSLKNGDIISCVCTELGGGTPLTSNTIPITVTSKVTPSVTIAKTPAGTTCSGINLNFYISTSQYLGTNPLYTWQKNTGGGYVTVSSGYGNDYSYYQTTTLTNGDKIRLTVLGNYSCVTTNTSVSNEITCTISGLVTPSVSISSDPDCIKLSLPIVFTATPTYGGTSPTYNWYYTDLSGNWKLGYTTSVSNTWTSWIFTGYTNTMISCSMTSNESCPSTQTVNSNYLNLYPCSCGQSTNKVINGGGDDTTDWVSFDGLIGDNWGMDVLPTYGATYITEIGNGTNGFTGNFQIVKTHIFSNSLCDLLTTGYNFSVNLGNQKYLIRFKYRCGETSNALEDPNNWNYKPGQHTGSTSGHLGIWAYYTDGTHACVVDVGPNIGNAIQAEKNFINSTGSKLRAFSFGHSQTVGNIYYKWEIDEVNLWECPNS